MNEEEQPIVRPIRSESDFREHFPPLVGGEMLMYRVQNVSLSRIPGDKGEEILGMALTFVGSDAPDILCSFPLSAAHQIRQVLHDLLRLP